MPTIQDTLNLLQDKRIDILFNQLYSHETSIIQKQIERYTVLINTFQSHFSNDDIHLFSTPGRTEIGGNHTDHNAGRILAAAINLDSVAVASKMDDQKVTLYSEGFDKPFIVQLNDLNPQDNEKESTQSLIRGIAARFQALGFKIGGFSACITSDVLVGSGLSSSASVEVLIGTIFNAFYNQNKISPKELAMIGQYAENVFFGKPCGLMDQTTCAVGGIVTIDFRDAEHPEVQKVAFDFNAQNTSILVVDTGGNHADLTEDYAAVPNEMKSVAKKLGGQVVRDICADDLIAATPKIRAEVGDRAILRALHFLGDNQRVVDQVEALQQNNFDRFLQLVNDSGNSSFKWLQNVYTTKNVFEQGVSLALALTENYIRKAGKGACRVHGGGFAGTIQVFLHNDFVQDYIQLMESVFGKGSVQVLTVRPVGTLHINLVIG